MKQKNNSDTLKKVYNATICESRYRFYRAVPWDLQIHDDYANFENDRLISDEKGVEINLSQEDFAVLCDNLQCIDTSGMDQRYLNETLKQHYYERKLREQYPALEKAYDKYRTLLVLVANGKDLPNG